MILSYVYLMSWEFCDLCKYRLFKQSLSYIMYFKYVINITHEKNVNRINITFERLFLRANILHFCTNIFFFIINIWNYVLYLQLVEYSINLFVNKNYYITSYHHEIYAFRKILLFDFCLQFFIINFHHQISWAIMGVSCYFILTKIQESATNMKLLYSKQLWKIIAHVHRYHLKKEYWVIHVQSQQELKELLLK